MHSFIRNEDGTFSIGVWLSFKDEGPQFFPMFDVGSSGEAMKAITSLNGGGTAYYPGQSYNYRITKGNWVVPQGRDPNEQKETSVQ
jgi:hypothetical protein